MYEKDESKTCCGTSYVEEEDGVECCGGSMHVGAATLALARMTLYLTQSAEMGAHLHLVDLSLLFLNVS